MCASAQTLENDYLVCRRAYHLQLSFMDGHWKVVGSQRLGQHMLPFWKALTSESLYQQEVHEQRFEGMALGARIPFLPSSTLAGGSKG